MKPTFPVHLAFALPLSVIGCGTTPGPLDPGPDPCDDGTPCLDEPPAESVCLDHLAADVLDDGCGVFAGGVFGGGDDANPGTKDKPVRTLQRAVALARKGRGRVFACHEAYFDPLTLPSGVDLIGGFDCRTWERMIPWSDGNRIRSVLQTSTDFSLLLTVEPAGPEDTGAADGVSRIVDFRVAAHGPIAVLAKSGATVEFLRGIIKASEGWAGHEGEELPGLDQAADGRHGLYGGDACSADRVPGGAAVVNPCDGGLPSTGGKGGDGLSDGAEDGDDGAPTSSEYGGGGRGDVPGIHCSSGSYGIRGAWGAFGAAGQGIGRIDETGWQGAKAGDGTWGMPGQGGGGGGGRRGGLSVCGVADKGGAGGGSGGAGGCGGRGGRGGENGHPSIGILALHAKVTVRDSEIITRSAGPGGAGGKPQDGGLGGRGAPGGALGDGNWSCPGGNGGEGGPGGYGGPGRGGDSIGIAYLDEDQLTVEGVTYDLGPPGKGGVSWDWSGKEITGEEGTVVETLRFPE
ncbi:hypothetical protein WME90_05365 [Sorangium sp. So ce375]|uniref:hypothetical protein n=1 Tax=Sorangium sp. So ce375 TaxID=3133306 RepID=UPI003F5C82C9